MPANVYRLYSGDVIDNNRYLFSIVASEYNAAYVVPSLHLESYGGFNKGRLIQIIRTTKELPETPEGWAILAKENIDRASMYPVDQYDTMEEALEAERELAEDLVDAKLKAKEIDNG
jgi:hypothetical protein